MRLNRHQQLTAAVVLTLEAVAREHGTTLLQIKRGVGPKMPEWFYNLEGAFDEFGYGDILTELKAQRGSTR